MTLKNFISKKYTIALIIIVALLSLTGAYFLNKKGVLQSDVLSMATSTASAESGDILNPPYPDDFFNFDYEQNAFKVLHDQSLKSILSNPIRYCGEGWYDEYNTDKDSNFKPKPGESFDCKDFGTGNSLVKRTSHDSKSVEKGPDQGLNLKTVSAYTIGKYKMTELDTGDVFSEVSDKSCSIKITDGDNEVFKIESKEYSCGSVDTVEQNGRALILFGGFSSGGNAYAGEEHYLFYDGSILHDLGSLVRQGYGSENFWIQNGDFVFWVYDGRYENSFRGSHNASTYAFIPRVFKIGLKNGTLQIIEGPTISPEIKTIYQHDLDAIRESFASSTKNKASLESIDKTSVEPFLAYWAGISRYLLSGQLLNSELDKILETQKVLGLQGAHEENSADQLYADIKGGVINSFK